MGALVAASLLISLLVLRRSQRSQAQLALADELELRRLLEDNPEDSLGYFALRRDKQAVFAADRRSAVAYRVELGVCLAAMPGPSAPTSTPMTWTSTCASPPSSS